MNVRRLPVLVSLALVAAAVACGGDDGGGDDAMPCDHIDLSGAAEDLALPSGYPASSFPLVGQNASCGPAGAPTYQLTDLDGDDTADLVVTTACGDATLGNTAWRVHRGGRDGFAAAQTWSLPPGYPADSFPLLAGAATCGPANAPTYALADLIGDGALDLVITSRCGDATTGTAHWRVHAGEDQGFAAAAIDFALPGGYPPDSFVVPQASASCGAAGLPTYGLADVTGDEHVDLVVTAACGDTGLGTTSWRVHAAGGVGFAAAATFALPAGYPADAFGFLSASQTCGPSGLPSYTTTDLDGDRRVDLVVTSACGDTTLGSTRWRLHAGGANGFGAARELALPAGYPADAFLYLGADAACGAAGLPSYTTTDADGDRRADLLVTSACGDAALGSTTWRLHHGAADGFAAADDVALPAGYPAASFPATVAVASCGPANLPTYVFFDGDGDGRRDLVLASRCGDAITGDTRWLIHRNRCVP